MVHRDGYLFDAARSHIGDAQRHGPARYAVRLFVRGDVARATQATRCIARRHSAALLLFSLAVGLKAGAAEVSPARPSPAEVHATGEWYGWQIMLADLGVIGALAGGGVLSSVSRDFAFIPIIGGVGYFAGGPLVHLGHGNPGGATKSLLLRLAVPFGAAALGVGVGALASKDTRSYECPRGCAVLLSATFGFGLGMLGAMVTDWVTASEPVRPGSRGSAASEPVWVPVLVLGSQGSGGGVVVRF